VTTNSSAFASIHDFAGWCEVNPLACPSTPIGLIAQPELHPRSCSDCLALLPAAGPAGRSSGWW